MLAFFGRLRAQIRRIIARLRAPQPAAPAPQQEPTAAAALPTTARDKARAHYERRRRRFDRFVEPQGPKPKPRTRKKRAAGKPKKPAAPAVIQMPIVVDHHHSDHQTDVLYEEEEILGQFAFRDTILDQLDRYFFYLNRMRKHDREAYAFYRRVGGVLRPYASIPEIWRYEEGRTRDEYPERRLSPWFCETRPGFGCTVYGANPEVEKIEQERRWDVPRLVYFVKYSKPPPEIQPCSGGDIYKMTVWWDRAWDKRAKWGRPQEFPVFVGRDGSMRIPLTLNTRQHVFHSRLGREKGERGRSSRLVQVSQHEWQIEERYKEWASTHHTTAERLLTELFYAVAQEIEMRQAMVMVSAAKGKNYALFTLDLLRASYFFQDRDYALTPGGQRKPIFHTVRAHRRKNGTIVPFHFRGDRRFRWAGYDVSITVPGKDHPALEDLNVGGEDAYWIDPKSDERYIYPAEYGALLRDMVDGGRRARKGESA